MVSIFGFSLIHIFISLSVSAIIYEAAWIVYCQTFHPLNKFPGPFLASFSRLWIWRVTTSGSREKVELELHKKYGSIVRIAPNELACSSPMAIKEIYRNQNPLQKTDFYSVWHNKDFGQHPDNFSNTDEKYHATRRRIVNNVYSMSNVLKSEGYIDVCSHTFIQKLEGFADRGEVIDLGQWLQMYAFDVVGELFFGKMFGFVEQGIDYGDLISSLDTLNPLLAAAAVSASYARPFLLISSIVDSSVRKALKAIAHVVDTAKTCVNERQKIISDPVKSQDLPRDDMLNQLFEIMREKGEKVDFGIQQVQYEAYVSLFAGSDTTAITMRSVFYHLSRNPQTLKKLLKEIDEAFPVAQHPLSETIKYSEAIELPLFNAAVKEAQRLHPSVGFTMPRLSPEPAGIEVCGKHIPPGQRIGLNAHVVQRDQTIYGTDADDFRPERWLASESGEVAVKEMDRCMLVFGAGTRTCIGKNISLAEIYKVIPQILRTFELEAVDTGKVWRTENFWFNKQTGLRFRLKRRVL